MAKHSERGSVLLIEMLVVFGLLMISLAIAAPAYMKVQSVTEQRDAASVLWRINQAELIASNAYDGYFNPTSLATNAIGLPAAGTACAPNLVSGNDTGSSPSKGYIFTFTQGTSATAITPSASCAAPPIIYRTYTITADPKTVYGRHFYTDQTGVVRFADGDTQATAASSAYTVSGVAGTNGAGSGNGNTSASPFKGLWDSTVTYQPGDIVLYNVGASGNTSVETFMDELSGAVVGEPPLADNVHWALISTNAAGSLGSAPTVLSGNSTGLNVILVRNQEPVWCSFFAQNPNGCGNVSGSDPHTGTAITEPFSGATFTVSGQSQWINFGGGGVQIYFLNDDTGQILAQCLIPADGNTWGCTVSSPQSIPALTHLEIEFEGVGGTTVNAYPLSWNYQ